MRHCRASACDHLPFFLSLSFSILVLSISLLYLLPISHRHQHGITITNTINIIAIIITVINILHRIFRRFCINFISNRKSRSITTILDLPSFCCYNIIIVIIIIILALFHFLKYTYSPMALAVCSVWFGLVLFCFTFKYLKCESSIKLTLFR